MFTHNLPKLKMSFPNAIQLQMTCIIYMLSFVFGVKEFIFAPKIHKSNTVFEKRIRKQPCKELRKYYVNDCVVIMLYHCLIES